MFDWSGLITNAIWTALGAAGHEIWSRFDAWRRCRGHAAILAGLEGPTLFVFPGRPGSPGRLLPQTAIEDFLAVNNIISAYLRIGRHPPEKMRDHTHLGMAERRGNNLILICSSKSNSVTKDAIEILRARNSRFAHLVPYFEAAPTPPDEIQIRCNEAIYRSKSFHQNGPRLDDMAVIMKAQNPWDAQRKILVVAGIRGIGTWGAAEMLKKWWKDIYDYKDQSRTRGTSKKGDFAAIVSVHYEDADIKEVRLCQLIDLDQGSTK